VAQLGGRVRDLQPGGRRGRLRRVVEHDEHGLAAGAAALDAVEHLLVAEEVVADVLHRLELAVRPLVRDEDARMAALERVEVGDVEEAPQPAVDAEQVERGRRDEVHRGLVRPEVRPDVRDAVQRGQRL
jgi:hypothetical protein